MKKSLIQTLFVLMVLSVAACSSAKKTKPYEFALMSADVYEKEEVPGLPAHIHPVLDFDPEEFKSSLNLDLGKISEMLEDKNWKKLAPYVIGKVIGRGGYSGRAYLNTKSKEIIIAHRGTDISYVFDPENGLEMPVDKKIWETFKDLDDNLDILEGEIPEQQWEAARFFTEKVKLVHQEKYKDQELSILHTGHSLGAVLAELSAVEGNTEAVTFESPGSLPMVQKLITSEHLENSNYKITTYNTVPNAINLLNPPAGKVIYLIKQDHRQSPQDAFGDTAIEAALSQHSIREVIRCFDPKTGKPKKK